MSLENGIKQTIEADTLEECKRKLYEKYGEDYDIEKRESIFKPCGFLGLKQKEVQRVTYTVKHKKAYENSSNYSQYSSYQAMSRENEEEKLKKNREEILRQQSDIVLASTLNTLSKQVSEINNKINTINTNINTSSKRILICYMGCHALL